MYRGSPGGTGRRSASRLLGPRLAAGGLGGDRGLLGGAGGGGLGGGGGRRGLGGLRPRRLGGLDVLILLLLLRGAGLGGPGGRRVGRVLLLPGQGVRADLAELAPWAIRLAGDAGVVGQVLDQVEELGAAVLGYGALQHGAELRDPRLDDPEPLERPVRV